MSRRRLLFLILGIILALIIIFILGSVMTGNATLNAQVVRGGFTGSKCTETDGGLDYNKFGIVTLTNEEGEDETIEDKCLSEGKFLIEYNCGFNPATNKWYFVSRKYECSEGCADGTCISDETEKTEINDEEQTAEPKEQITQPEVEPETKTSFFKRTINFFKNLF